MLLSNASHQKQASTQDGSTPFHPMTETLPVKMRKGVVPVKKVYEDNSSVADNISNPTQVQTSARITVSTGKSSGETPSTEKSKRRSGLARDIVGKRNRTSGRRLLPVMHRQAVGTSYAQPAISDHLLLEEPKRDKHHKVQGFSSQKMLQPFLDR